MENRTTLMIVDVQKGMFNTDDPVANGDEILVTLRQLITQARESGTPIIYIQHIGEENSILGLDQPVFPIHPDITPRKDDIIIKKHHSDSFQETKLQRELENLHITRIVLAGIQTEYCVDTTCRRAYSLGYDVRLVQDAHTTWDTEQLRASQIIAHHNEVLGNSFASLVLADETKF
jgi:nicotinamidase-related amidase